MSIPVITIDGPTASGKGTIAQRVAKILGWHYLDSGALYRLTGLSAARKGLFPISQARSEAKGSSGSRSADTAQAEILDESGFAACAAELKAYFDVDKVYLDGVDVSSEIRTETAGHWASLVGAMPKVRLALLQRQRDFRQPPGLVADGRDMGTVVFPDAQTKIYLTASVESRAQRRFKQLIEKEIPVTFESLLEDLRVRDLRDSSRAIAPLKPADDAILVDSTALDIEETVQAVLYHYRS